MKTIKPADIPSYGDYDGGECIALPGATYARVRIRRDDDMGEPWKEHDGHGPVSDWVTRDKAPGELLLCADGRSKRFYDFAEACKIARRDGWDAPPYKTGTAREQAARAARRDFDYLRRWCNDYWYWIGAVVTLHTADGAQVGDASLWGFESDGNYWREVSADLINELRAEYAQTRREARKAAKAAAYTALQMRAFVGCPCGA